MNSELSIVSPDGPTALSVNGNSGAVLVSFSWKVKKNWRVFFLKMRWTCKQELPVEDTYHYWVPHSYGQPKRRSNRNQTTPQLTGMRGMLNSKPRLKTCCPWQKLQMQVNYGKWRKNFWTMHKVNSWKRNGVACTQNLSGAKNSRVRVSGCGPPEGTIEWVAHH